MLPLDPIAESPVSPLLDRLVSLMLVCCAVGFIWFLSQVEPDARGHGTHEKLGMTPCSWVSSYGKPCPTCGVTTAATHLVQLNPWAAVRTQPFGAALAGFGLWLAGVAMWCLLRGRSFLDYLLRLPQGSLFVWGVILLLASWLYVYLTFTP